MFFLSGDTLAVLDDSLPHCLNQCSGLKVIAPPVELKPRRCSLCVCKPLKVFPNSYRQNLKKKFGSIMYMKGVAQGMFTTQRIFRCFHKPKNTAPFP